MTRHTILYVDDELMNLKLFALQFRKEYEVLTETDPSKVLTILQEQSTKIDLVITDYMMPQINGMDLVRLIKQHFPDKICIMLTGFMVDEVLKDESAMSLIHDYILKPYDRSDLMQKLHKALAA